MEVLVAQLCLTLCDPMDCNLMGSSVHGILQARILEWITIPFSRENFPTLNLGLLHCRQNLYYLNHSGSPNELRLVAKIKPLMQAQVFPGGSEVKASASNARDLGSIPGSGRSPGEGNGNPLQYSCLENPMDRRAWWATVHRVAKSQTQLSDFTFTRQAQNTANIYVTYLN